MSAPAPRLPLRELRKRSQPRRGLSLREAAIYLGVNERQFARAVTRQEAPQPRLLLGKMVFDLPDLDDWIERQPVRGERPKPGPRAIRARI